jgi:pimeloyl-ACP methyl ester carboxylesterase
MDQILDIQGIPTRLRRVGVGPEVVVLHGWGASIEAVQSITAGLADVCAVHTVDLPGFGQTGRPPGVWGVEDYSEWTRALFTSLGLSRPSIIGHSHGGRIAIHLAAHHPELVDRLLLVDAAGIRPRRTAAWYRKVALAKVAKHVLNRLGSPGRAVGQRLVGYSASSDYAASDSAMRPTFVRLVNTDLTALLPDVHASTLLVWGDQDTETPLSDGETMARLIPDAGLVVFQGAGHFSYADQPQRFTRVARHFLADPVAASSARAATTRAGGSRG